MIWLLKEDIGKVQDLSFFRSIFFDLSMTGENNVLKLYLLHKSDKLQINNLCQWLLLFKVKITKAKHRDLQSRESEENFIFTDPSSESIEHGNISSFPIKLRPKFELIGFRKTFIDFGDLPFVDCARTPRVQKVVVSFLNRIYIYLLKNARATETI